MHESLHCNEGFIVFKRNRVFRAAGIDGVSAAIFTALRKINHRAGVRQTDIQVEGKFGNTKFDDTVHAHQTSPIDIGFGGGVDAEAIGLAHEDRAEVEILDRDAESVPIRCIVLIDTTVAVGILEISANTDEGVGIHHRHLERGHRGGRSVGQYNLL
ncbi:MAG: hypothetical protein SynsKO_24070 [Synoicihabitans sp.]